MGLNQIISQAKQVFPSILIVLVAIAGAGAALWLLPNQTAAVVLGVLAAIALTYLVAQHWQRTTQIAVFWLSAGVIGDAAYAKLNDVAPVTLANLVIQLAEAVVKLGDILVSSLGVSGLDMRSKVAAVTPDFVWALILTATLLMASRLFSKQRNSNSRPELRRAA